MQQNSNGSSITATSGLPYRQLQHAAVYHALLLHVRTYPGTSSHPAIPDGWSRIRTACRTYCCIAIAAAGSTPRRGAICCRCIGRTSFSSKRRGSDGCSNNGGSNTKKIDTAIGTTVDAAIDTLAALTEGAVVYAYVKATVHNIICSSCSGMCSR